MLLPAHVATIKHAHVAASLDIMMMQLTHDESSTWMPEGLKTGSPCPKRASAPSDSWETSHILTVCNQCLLFSAATSTSSINTPGPTSLPPQLQQGPAAQLTSTHNLPPQTSCRRDQQRNSSDTIQLPQFSAARNSNQKNVCCVKSPGRPMGLCPLAVQGLYPEWYPQNPGQYMQLC
jgi:hypothetical protein